MNNVITNSYKTQVFNSKIIIDNVDSKLEQATWYLLTKCLKHQTNKLDSLEDVYYQLEEYYAASTSISLAKRDNKLELHLCATMVGGIDEAIQNADKVLSLLIEQVYDSKLVTSEIFEKEKEKINLSYKNWQNNKQAVAIQNGLYKIEDSIRTSKINDPEFINQITLDMVNEKKKSLQAMKIQDVYFVGNKMPNIAHNNLIFSPNYSMFEPKQINQKFKSGEYVVNTQNSQSYLIVFWSIGEILSAKESIVLQIVNSIFGSSPNSKLFMNIREKHSLSYHTSSAYIDGINVIMGFAGIQADKFDLAKTVMLEQMNQLSKSVISVEEIKSAKQRYSEIFKSATDSADQLILVNSILKSLGFETKQEAIEYIDSIGIIDIEKMIKKINQQPLIYFEKGEIDE
jgi:hypothetical protein